MKQIQTIYYTKSVYTKGFSVMGRKQETMQDNCQGHCIWKSMGIANWHRCINCKTEEMIDARMQCGTCGKRDETVSVRSCGYQANVNNDPNFLEQVCNACEEQHCLDI